MSIYKKLSNSKLAKHKLSQYNTQTVLVLYSILHHSKLQTIHNKAYNDMYRTPGPEKVIFILPFITCTSTNLSKIIAQWNTTKTNCNLINIKTNLVCRNNLLYALIPPLTNIWTLHTVKRTSGYWVFAQEESYHSVKMSLECQFYLVYVNVLHICKG